MKTVTNENSANDTLICPITCEIFRDPVIAKDGHVYERDAITKWILQNGTSPLTREPLQIEELRPDDHLRNLAAEWRKSTVSENISLEMVTLPSTQSTPSIITQIPSVRFNYVVVDRRSHKFSFKKSFRAIALLIAFVIIVTAIVITAISLNSNKKIPRRKRPSTPPDVSTPTYSNSWTGSLINKNTSIPRTKGDDIYYFKEYKVTATSSNIYKFTINSSIRLRACLYHRSLTSLQLSNILLKCDNNSDGSRQFSMLYRLQSQQQYRLVLSAQNANTTGRFTIIVSSSIALAKDFLS